MILALGAFADVVAKNIYDKSLLLKIKTGSKALSEKNSPLGVYLLQNTK
jgi:hypothetical protein